MGNATSRREREDDEGGDERYVKIDRGSKTSNGLKSLKEMKEYLRSEFEKAWQSRKHGALRP